MLQLHATAWSSCIAGVAAATTTPSAHYHVSTCHEAVPDRAVLDRSGRGLIGFKLVQADFLGSEATLEDRTNADGPLLGGTFRIRTNRRGSGLAWTLPLRMTND